jgi:hypothetical protein
MAAFYLLCTLFVLGLLCFVAFLFLNVLWAFIVQKLFPSPEPRTPQSTAWPRGTFQQAEPGSQWYWVAEGDRDIVAKNRSTSPTE